MFSSVPRVAGRTASSHSFGPTLTRSLHGASRAQPETSDALQRGHSNWKTATRSPLSRPAEYTAPAAPVANSQAYADLFSFRSYMRSMHTESSGYYDITQPTPAELASYVPLKWNEPDGLRKLTAEEESKFYDDLHKYGPVTSSSLPKDPMTGHSIYNELGRILGDLDAPVSTVLGRSDVAREIPKAPVVEAKNPGAEYQDLHLYGPIMWNEPDGLRPPTAEELSKNYNDLARYGAVRWNEPDGKLPPSMEEQSKNYEDLHKYNKGVRHNEPDGKAPPSKEELSKNYNDLDNYEGPFSHNEPDGLPKGQTRESRLAEMASTNVESELPKSQPKVVEKKKVQTQQSSFTSSWGKQPQTPVASKMSPFMTAMKNKIFSSPSQHQ